MVAGITAATANAIASNNNMDDILAVARVFSHKDRRYPLSNSEFYVGSMLILIRVHCYLG